MAITHNINRISILNLLISGCTKNSGAIGDGTTQGTCMKDEHRCMSNGECSRKLIQLILQLYLVYQNFGIVAIALSISRFTISIFADFRMYKRGWIYRRWINTRNL